MNKYTNKTILIDSYYSCIIFSVKSSELFFRLCFVVLALNNNNSVDSVIVFYIIPSFTHSSLVLSDFLSSSEHKCYFE